jgi:hypothetical protein
MISRSSPPFAWPESSDPNRVHHCAPQWVSIPELDGPVSLISAVWGLNLWKPKVFRCDFPNLRLRLVVNGAREA